MMMRLSLLLTWWCSNMVMWRDLGISSWPTLVVVSPRGRVLATFPGQPAGVLPCMSLEGFFLHKGG